MCYHVDSLRSCRWEGCCHFLLEGQTTFACDGSGHLQNGKPARCKNRRKLGKKMEDAPRPRMAEEWPPKWKKMAQLKKGQIPICVSIDSILGAIFWPSQAWGHFLFSCPFSRICGHPGFPCRKRPLPSQTYATALTS